MLQQFLRRGQEEKWADRPDCQIAISGRVPVLNLDFAHGRSGFQPTVENLPEGCHESGGFFGGFLHWISLVTKCKRKIRRKNPPENPTAENKKIRPRGFSLQILSGVAPANQTKERSVHELFAGTFRNKSSIRESCLFS